MSDPNSAEFDAFTIMFKRVNKMKTKLIEELNKYDYTGKISMVDGGDKLLVCDYMRIKAGQLFKLDKKQYVENIVNMIVELNFY